MIIIKNGNVLTIDGKPILVTMLDFSKKEKERKKVGELNNKYKKN